MSCLDLWKQNTVQQPTATLKGRKTAGPQGNSSAWTRRVELVDSAGCLWGSSLGPAGQTDAHCFMLSNLIWVPRLQPKTGPSLNYMHVQVICQRTNSPLLLLKTQITATLFDMVQWDCHTDVWRQQHNSIISASEPLCMFGWCQWQSRHTQWRAASVPL